MGEPFGVVKGIHLPIKIDVKVKTIVQQVGEDFVPFIAKSLVILITTRDGED